MHRSSRVSLWDAGYVPKGGESKDYFAEAIWHSGSIHDLSRQGREFKPHSRQFSFLLLLGYIDSNKLQFSSLNIKLPNSFIDRESLKFV